MNLGHSNIFFMILGKFIANTWTTSLRSPMIQKPILNASPELAFAGNDSKLYLAGSNYPMPRRRYFGYIAELICIC